MILSHRRLVFNVSLLVVALAGLLGVQAVLLQHAWQLRAQAFDRNVRSALALAVNQLDAAEIAVGADAIILVGAEFDSTRTDGAVKTRHVEKVVKAFPDLPDSLTHSQFQTWASIDHLQEGTSASTLTVQIEGDRHQVIQRVVSEIFHAERMPVAERLAAVPLDSILTGRLQEADIDVSPSFAVVEAESDSTVHLSGVMDESAITASPFRARLFSLDMAPPFYDLVLLLPGERAWMLRKAAPLFIAALVFSAFVIGGFVQTVRTLLEQRRFAAQVVGFVNNMTHEFKTPLSTLTLAAEAIASQADPANEPLMRHTRMIREETARMGLQVERILQVAHLERGELSLSSAPLDGVRLVNNAAETFSLRARNLGGSLEVATGVPKADLMGDEMHLAAVLDNLLDNALKYSMGPPEISLSADIQGRKFVVRVTDRGPGVPRADRERAFEPYYRCPTGDRHDVKGHGLGLSYVRIVTRAHGGDVVLAENPGGGTIATLLLPLGTEERTA